MWQCEKEVIEEIEILLELLRVKDRSAKLSRPKRKVGTPKKVMGMIDERQRKIEDFYK